MSGMNIIRKHKILFAVCITALICLLALASVITNKEKISEVGRIEKEGDISSIPADQLSREKLIVGVSGITGIPYLAATDGDEIAGSLVYEPLLTFDADGKIVFAVASKMEVNDTGDVYTLYIDKNRKFSNGTQVTPEDIKLSYQLMSDSSVESRYNASLSYIKGYSDFRNGLSTEIKGITTGDGFVTFEFVGSSWTNIDAFGIPITNASSIEYEKGSARYIIDEKKFELLGTGAYVLSSVNYDGVELLRVEAKIDEFAQVLISPVGISSVVSLFKRGLLDMYTFEQNSDLIAEIEQTPQISLYSYVSPSTPYIGINCRYGALNDVKVRRGFSLAIQDQRDKARKQFAKAGYVQNAQGTLEKDSNTLDITIITYNAKSFTDDCEYIAGLLEALGVRVTIVPLGLSELRERIKNEEFDLYYTKSEVGRHGSVYFMYNEIEGLKDDKIEKLKQEMEDETDYAEYQKIYSNLVKAYEDMVTRIVPKSTRKYIMYSPRLKNIDPNPYTNEYWRLDRYKRV